MFFKAPLAPKALIFPRSWAPDRPWVLTSSDGPTATFSPEQGRAASDWIEKNARSGRGIYTLIPSTREGLSRQPVARDLAHTVGIAISVPKAAASKLNALPFPPSALIDGKSASTAIWRLNQAATLSEAKAIGDKLAAEVGGKPTLFAPLLAGLSPVEVVYYRKGVVYHPGVLNGSSVEKFTRADQITAKPLDWLWPGVLLAGAFSIIAGEAGVGKSTIAAMVAATVSSGSRWPDIPVSGARAEAAGVIFCEGEDSVDRVTWPRLKAAGADLSRISLGPVCDLSQSITRITEAAESVDAKLIVLSPVRSFFGVETYNADELRRRLAPIQAWAEIENVCILGVSHPKAGKKDFAGSGGWKQIARAGLFAERDEDTGERTVRALKANSGRDDWTLGYETEGVNLSDGIETSRIKWIVSQDERRPPKAEARRPKKATLSKASPITWLEKELANGPRMIVELVNEARMPGGPGYSRATLYRAAATLQVATMQSGPREQASWYLSSKED